MKRTKTLSSNNCNNTMPVGCSFSSTRTGPLSLSSGSRIWLTSQRHFAIYTAPEVLPPVILPPCSVHFCSFYSPNRKSASLHVDELYRVPLYAILSGFEPGDVPGIGTFYDFFSRLWAASKNNIKPRKNKRKRKPKKGKKGEKAPTTTHGRIMRLANWMMHHMDTHKDLPMDRLFHFFQSQFLAVSARLGLLGDKGALGIAGDGTPVVTAAYPRSKPTCNCHAQGLAKCNHPRIYSQPDCNSGWDSARERFFNGYHLYTLTAANSPYDLPLYPRLHPASRHDAVSFVVSSVEFSQRFTLGMVDKMLLDAAHDAGPIL